MSKIIWDQEGKRLYETGVDHGVLYPQVSGAYPLGVAWNGITTVDESPSGAESNPIYADNIKYLNLISNEEFGCTINAYTYPDEFGPCDGSATAAGGLVHVKGQTRQKFAFSYRTLIGNDELGTDYGYEIHIVYGCNAAPSSKSRSTTNDSPEAAEMSWEITTTPVNVTSKDDNGKPIKPIAHLVVRSTDFTVSTQSRLEELENTLYGTEDVVSVTYTEVEVSEWASETDYYTAKKENPDVTKDSDFQIVDKTQTPTPEVGTDYYTRAESTVRGLDPKCPLPDEIFSILAGNT